MAKIHELSETLTNQIAAGEVIERPASVVKELIENSIDAGASRIRIDFTEAGLKQIVVQDNGSGIEADQIDLAFMRHATSKINNERDLFRVATLGFRGEALASIAAVSQVEILTRASGVKGTRAEFSGGQKKLQEDAAAQKGTQIIVNNLFFNTPARLKYLRSPRTEMTKIIDIVNRVALGYSKIAFTLTNNGKVLFRTAGNGNLQQTVANIYGRPVAEKMLPIKMENADFKINGLISRPELTRSTRNFISILLNGRYIRNYQLNSAIMDGYANKMDSRHYPVAVIAIKVDPFLVDVNVHPTKQEVRLSKEKELGRLISQAISEAIMEKQDSLNTFSEISNTDKPTLVDQLQFNLNKNVVDTSRKIPETNALEAKNIEVAEQAPEFVDLNTPRSDKRYHITSTWDKNVQLQAQLTPFGDTKPKTNKQELLSSGDATLSKTMPELKLVGMTNELLIAEHEQDLYLVDQLRLRRKLQYYKILGDINNPQVVKQTLLTPIVLEFGQVDFLKLKDKIAELTKIGIELEEFGDNSYLVRNYPVWLQGDIERSLHQILDQFLDSEMSKSSRIISWIANEEAKKQVTQRIKLSQIEASDLLKQLSTLPDPYYDQDGQRIFVRLTATDINKLFKGKNNV